MLCMRACIRKGLGLHDFASGEKEIWPYFSLAWVTGADPSTASREWDEMYARFPGLHQINMCLG